MKKITATLSALLIGLLCVCGASARVFEPSDWAKGSFDEMISMGAIPPEIFTKNYSDKISRAEFALLIYDAFGAHTGTEYIGGAA